MRDEAHVRPSRSKVERRRNAGINRPGVLNNDNAVNAKRITGRDITVGAAAVTNTATKSNKPSIVVKGSKHFKNKCGREEEEKENYDDYNDNTAVVKHRVIINLL